MLGETPQRFAAVSLYMFLSITSFFFLAKVRQRKRSLPPRYTAITFSMATICVLCIGLVLEFSPPAIDHETAWLIGIISGVFMLMTIAWLFIMDTFAAKHYDNLVLQSELQQREAELHQAQTLHSMYEHLQGLRHDFKNQMQSLQGYVKELDWQGLNDHLSDLQGDIDRYLMFSLSGLPQLDMLLSIKMQQAEKMRLQLFVSCVLPTVLSISPVDLCSIVSNIFDNAIEAQEGVSEDARYLRLVFEPLETMWVIRLENSSTGRYRRDSEERFLSTKQGDSRGIGLKRVMKLVEENNGFCQVDAANKFFSIEIYLPCGVPE
jgi:sensor histidine kinase YesM